MHEIGRDLGSGLSTLVTLFDISFFVIGGGFGAALDVLRPGTEELLAEQRYGSGVHAGRACDAWFRRGLDRRRSAEPHWRCAAGPGPGN